MLRVSRSLPVPAPARVYTRTRDGYTRPVLCPNLADRKAPYIKNRWAERRDIAYRSLRWVRDHTCKLRKESREVRERRKRISPRSTFCRAHRPQIAVHEEPVDRTPRFRTQQTAIGPRPSPRTALTVAQSARTSQAHLDAQCLPTRSPTTILRPSRGS